MKQLYNQAALNQLENGSFAGSNDGSLNCTGTNNNLAKIAQPLIDQGIIVKCFSFYGTDRIVGSPDLYDGDDYLRFGATALIYDTGELKAWSVDENGVVKWDIRSVDSSGISLSGDDVLGSNIMVWKTSGGVTTAANACATNGGKLPSLEQLRTLSYAWYSKALTFTPLGFVTDIYWSSSPVPSSSASLIYGRDMSNGSVNSYSWANHFYVRCVR